ncbi:Uncharacterised protein [Mycobacteroides abscessus]|nr:Uncharacterised protein [Mycobacteroides abscessus]
MPAWSAGSNTVPSASRYGDVAWSTYEYCFSS